MRYLLSISLLITLFFMASCDDKDSMNDSLADLTNSNAKAFAPYDLLTENSKFVFVDSIGNEKTLDLSYSFERIERRLDNQTYMTDQDSFIFRDSQENDYGILILVSAHHFRSGNSSEFMDCWISTNANNGYLPRVSLYIEWDNSENTFFQNITLNGRTFNEVYANTKPDEIGNVLSRVFYSKEFGIVAFRGNDGRLWSLDRFE